MVYNAPLNNGDRNGPEALYRYLIPEVLADPFFTDLSALLMASTGAEGASVFLAGSDTLHCIGSAGVQAAGWEADVLMDTSKYRAGMPIIPPTSQGIHAVAYPLVTSEGEFIGLTAIFHRDQQVLPQSGEALARVSRMAMHQLDMDRLSSSQASVRQSEQRLWQMANTLPLVVWTATPEGYLNYLSEQWGREYGLPMEQSLGDGWVRFVHPDDLQTVRGAWEHSLLTGEDYEVEFRLLHKSSGYRWTLVRALPIRDEQGRVVQWCGSDTDIEEKKQAEVLLEQKVLERTRELEQRNLELEQFTYISHHDLQEPLRKIIMFSGMVEAEASSQLGPSALGKLAKVTDAARRMSRALRDVLNFASLNKVEQFSDVDLNIVFTAVMNDLELVVQEKNASVSADALPTVKAVPVQMHQLFYNLLNNALKFSKPDIPPRIRISCKLLERGEWTQQYGLNREESYWEIRVIDNGIGFSSYSADKIFNIFHRLHNQQEYSGTGIGLAMVKKIVQNHDGRIRAESEPGRGATFIMYFPDAGFHQHSFRRRVMSVFNVKVNGSGDRVILFANGLGCDQKVWRYMAAAFEGGHKVITFDYIGMGGSDVSAYNAERYASLSGYAEDILDICHALDLKDIIFIGHSVSSMVGMLAAIQEPQLFSKMVMIGASPRYLNDPPYIGGFERQEIDGLLTLMKKNYLEWTRFFAPKAMGNPARPELSEKLMNIFCSVDPDIMYQFAKASFLSDCRKDLGKLNVPTLVLQPREDIVASDHIGSYICERIPDCSLYRMEAKGHYPHLSAEKETEHAIRSFIGKEGKNKREK